MEKKTVAVAMSGGVDSSLTAALLLEQGYEVMGLTMRLSEESMGAEKDARSVAGALGIPHHVADFRELFRQKVVDYFIGEYARGRTPNPCVACNLHLKFGALFAYARSLGADCLATGHYARIVRDASGRYRLCKGLDEGKDQSYVLYHLPQEVLSRVLLPLGSYSKDTVRAMAMERRLPVANKPDSQEICFVPKDDYQAYLRKHAPECLCAGDIVDDRGNVLGRHEGVPLYTIGQRRGLGIAAPEPLYVKGLDVASHRVIVGGATEVYSGGLLAGQLKWMQQEEPKTQFRAMAKIRYGRRVAACRVLPLGDGQARVEFDEPQRAVTPGQSVVFYEGDYVLGGGIIEEEIP
ncbi:MAG: tRNA 2-thiouridine(34) synthase MnmA [Selenomonadaceae bacterium]|nr:tRNA 2-thiouridine(34) synthase MnmA [Selenomonadaceae bacterium]